MESKLKLVIFDLDGTLLDTIKQLAVSMNVARTMSGLEEQPMDEVQAMVGNGIRNLVRKSLAVDKAKGIEADEDKVYKDFTAFYNVNCVDNTYPYEGIPELLKELRDMGLKTALVSNKPDFPSHLICEARLPGLLDDIRGQIEGVPLKPDKTGVYETLRKLDVAPEEAIYVGDSEVDILTGKNAGMPCISVDWGFKTHEFLVEHNAEIIVSSVDELKKVILEFMEG